MLNLFSLKQYTLTPFIGIEYLKLFKQQEMGGPMGGPGGPMGPGPMGRGGMPPRGGRGGPMGMPRGGRGGMGAPRGKHNFKQDL